MGKINEHDRRMRKRLMLILPIVILAHFLALVTLARIEVLKDAISLGYEGPPKFESEISIIDNRIAPVRVASHERRVMVVQDVLIEGEDKPKRAKGNEPAPRPAERRREQQISLEMPGDFAYRTYASRAAAPYREDYVILKMVKPEYPADALLSAEEGYVLVEAYIAKDGTVNEAYVRSSYGSVSFETSSLNAVKQFLFKPVHEGGKPVSFWVSFLVKFQLRR
ncbi:MAG: TonB family protein [Candidatus Krumholzibacteria bacterium]|nr:TonB family protein [Candidatus Krumholzibacteria bacterium]